jgi:tryptophan 2,3-dioxygenase
MGERTYRSYLRLDELLELQDSGPEHDEMLFIVVHQVYELWFKEVLHELDHAMELLRAGDRPRARHTLFRVRTIVKVLVAQLDVLETMTPLQFLSFRDRLEAGSGFQSTQFRELEFVLGHKDAAAIDRAEPDAPGRARLRRRLEEPTLWDAFLAHLAGARIEVGEERLGRDVREGVQPDPALQGVLAGVYRTDPDLAGLCEALVDLDEGMQEWRYRHVKMVERTIGTKPGTGGSSGAAYLRTTLHQPFFPDLWDLRTLL